MSPLLDRLLFPLSAAVSPIPVFPPRPEQKRVQEYGCFVDFGAASDGLVHISELTNGFVENVGDVVAENQEVQVRFDPQTLAPGPTLHTLRLNLERTNQQFQEQRNVKMLTRNRGLSYPSVHVHPELELSCLKPGMCPHRLSFFRCG
jgi:hypothetical protein